MPYQTKESQRLKPLGRGVRNIDSFKNQEYFWHARLLNDSVVVRRPHCREM